MESKLDLSLPKRTETSGKKERFIPTLLLLLLLISAIQLGFTLVRPASLTAPAAQAALEPSVKKDLALKLEKQGFAESAVDLWKEYLSSAQLKPPKRAKLWYRIGKLHQQADAPELALRAYYRSESYAKLPQLEAELGRRIQESLEAAGKF